MHSLRHCEDAQRTFSTLTLFFRTFSTMTVESFHDYDGPFRPFTLILFHDYDRSHMLCAVSCYRGMNANSLFRVEKVRKPVWKRLRPTWNKLMP
jgi:hypothetical protein